MLVTLYEIGAVYFRLPGTNGFHLSAENETLLRTRVVVGGSNMKISRRHLADYGKTLHQKACRTSSTIIFSHSTIQIIDLWCCRCRCRSHFLNSLFSCEDAMLVVKKERLPWLLW